MTETRVAVPGHGGRVGSVLAGALSNEPGITYVGGLGRGDDLAAFLHEKRPRALIDFTQPAEALHNALAAVAAGASPIVGTTGLSGTGADKLETGWQAKCVAGIVEANFAVEVVLLMDLGGDVA